MVSLTPLPLPLLLFCAWVAVAHAQEPTLTPQDNDVTTSAPDSYDVTTFTSERNDVTSFTPERNDVSSFTPKNNDVTSPTPENAQRDQPTTPPSSLEDQSNSEDDMESTSTVSYTSVSIVNNESLNETSPHTSDNSSALTSKTSSTENEKNNDFSHENTMTSKASVNMSSESQDKRNKSQNATIKPDIKADTSDETATTAASLEENFHAEADIMSKRRLPVRYPKHPEDLFSNLPPVFNPASVQTPAVWTLSTRPSKPAATSGVKSTTIRASEETLDNGNKVPRFTKKIKSKIKFVRPKFNKVIFDKPKFGDKLESDSDVSSETKTTVTNPPAKPPLHRLRGRLPESQKVRVHKYPMVINDNLVSDDGNDEAEIKTKPSDADNLLSNTPRRVVKTVRPIVIKRRPFLNLNKPMNFSSGIKYTATAAGPTISTISAISINKLLRDPFRRSRPTVAHQAPTTTSPRPASTTTPPTTARHSGSNGDDSTPHTHIVSHFNKMKVPVSPFKNIAPPLSINQHLQSHFTLPTRPSQAPRVTSHTAGRLKSSQNTSHKVLNLFRKETNKVLSSQPPSTDDQRASNLGQKLNNAGKLTTAIPSTPTSYTPSTQPTIRLKPRPTIPSRPIVTQNIRLSQATRLPQIAWPPPTPKHRPQHTLLRTQDKPQHFKPHPTKPEQDLPINLAEPYPLKQGNSKIPTHFIAQQHHYKATRKDRPKKSTQHRFIPTQKRTTPVTMPSSKIIFTETHREPLVTGAAPTKLAYKPTTVEPTTFKRYVTPHLLQSIHIRKQPPVHKQTDNIYRASPDSHQVPNHAIQQARPLHLRTTPKQRLKPIPHLRTAPNQQLKPRPHLQPTPNQRLKPILHLRTPPKQQIKPKPPLRTTPNQRLKPRPHISTTPKQRLKPIPHLRTTPEQRLKPRPQIPQGFKHHKHPTSFVSG